MLRDSNEINNQLFLWTLGIAAVKSNVQQWNSRRTFRRHGPQWRRCQGRCHFKPVQQDRVGRGASATWYAYLRRFWFFLVERLVDAVWALDVLIFFFWWFELIITNSDWTFSIWSLSDSEKYCHVNFKICFRDYLFIILFFAIVALAIWKYQRFD